MATLYKFTLDFMKSSVCIHKYFYSEGIYDWLESLENSLYYDRTCMLFINSLIYISSFDDIFKTHKIGYYFQDSRFGHIILVCVTQNRILFSRFKIRPHYTCLCNHTPLNFQTMHTFLLSH